MSQSIRHPEILETARRQGKVTVEGLAEQLGVTLQTIRRYLTDLAEAGRLERVHGGANPVSGLCYLLVLYHRIHLFHPSSLGVVRLWLAVCMERKRAVRARND